MIEIHAEINNLSEFPKELKGIKSLRLLNISSNKISHIGKSIGTLRSLEYLSMEQNALAAIPADIGKLVMLKSLKVNGNKLEQVCFAGHAARACWEGSDASVCPRTPADTDRDWPLHVP